MQSSPPSVISKPAPKRLLQNLYQIPTCSICLQDLKGRLVSLQCGHVFHEQCIMSNLEYSWICPYCKEEIIDIQIRRLHFNNELVQISQIYAQVIASLSSPASNQIQKLVEDCIQKTREREEAKHKLLRCQKQKKIIKKILTNRRHQQNSQIQQMIRCIGTMNHQLSSHKQEAIQKTEEIARQQKLLKTIQNENKGLQGKIDALYRNNQILRSRNKQHENTLHSQEQKIEFLRLQIKQIHNSNALQRKKYDIFKHKFSILSQLARQNGVPERQIPDIREPIQTIQSFAQETSQKPVLKTNASVTIGGFGCKNKLKTLMKSM